MRRVTAWFAPSPRTWVPSCPPTNPERGSLAVKPTATSALYQPAAFAGRSRLALAVGAVLSMFTPLKVCVVELPAASVTVTVQLCPAPSFVNTVEPVAAETKPDPPASPAVYVAETSVLFQPAAL